MWFDDKGSTLNLLWVVEDPHPDWPAPAIPSWSWASVDGAITHRLHGMRLLSRQGIRSLWADGHLHVAIKEVSEDRAAGSRIDLGCDRKLFSLASLDKDVPDIFPEVANLSSAVSGGDGIFCLLVLSFTNVGNDEKELHGIVLRESVQAGSDRKCYMRVGYFQTKDGHAMQEGKVDITLI